MHVLCVILGESVSDIKLVCLVVVYTYTTRAHIFIFYFQLSIITAPLRRRKKFLRHEKGWMRRKRMKMERRHLRLHEQVEELKTFIKFKQDYRP